MKKLLAILFSFILSVSIVSCGKDPGEETKEFIDYASQLKLDTNDGKAYETVTLYNGERGCIDGDTTHFNSVHGENGVLKARYLAIDTPESTGKIEAWGKKAAKFNKEKLVNAKEIIIQSDNGSWNLDSTGSRYLVWVWYKATETSEFRCLNLELVQEGLSKTKSFSDTGYGEVFGKAYSQAIDFKLKLYGTEKDDEFDYGSYTPVTIKEIKDNVGNPETTYVGKNVRFEGTIFYDCGGNTVLVQDYDAETETWYGLNVYYHFNFAGISLMKIGYRVSFAGTLVDSESYGLQLTSVSYSAYSKPGSAGYEKSIRLVSENNDVTPVEMDAKTYTENYASTMDLVVSMKNLKVVDIYTTKNEASSSVGAMTFTCLAEDNTQVQIRTSVLYEDDKTTVITADRYQGKTIDIVGITDKYESEYQIHVYLAKDITIH